jgi:hypothetical protein
MGEINFFLSPLTNFGPEFRHDNSIRLILTT